MNTITEDYVSYEVAKLLKEKGFNEFCDTGWDNNLYDKAIARNFSYGFDKKETWISRPTLQMACKWLREIHKIDIEIFVTYKNKIPHYQWRIDCLNNQDTIVETPCCNTYEEAVEAALKYVLENLI